MKSFPVYLHNSIGNTVDRAGNRLQRFFILDEDDLQIIETARDKFYLGQCSFYPNKNRGDGFPRKYFNIRNMILYESEARMTPCVLYCWKITTNTGQIFYKVGISVTRHVKSKDEDESEIDYCKRLITYRGRCTRNNFNIAGNGSIAIQPLFLVRTSLFNCIVLENAIHRNSVFNQCLKQQYNHFSGLSECCRYLDFDQLKELKLATEEHNSRVQSELDEHAKSYFKENNVDPSEIFHPAIIKYSNQADKYELDKYHWVKFCNISEHVDIKENQEIISVFRRFESLSNLKNWISLYELQNTIQ